MELTKIDAQTLKTTEFTEKEAFLSEQVFSFQNLASSLNTKATIRERFSGKLPPLTTAKKTREIAENLLDFPQNAEKLELSPGNFFSGKFQANAGK